ncbi:MAG TPA: S-methyl-5'-thioadenosine phosphorylase [Candidatus Dormibacteraeota bacterium]|jgi:5'-methylthioadenosine phosphorylase|nr:S-methyl-5'-thioadenosine phosphorylase [Candidatus Dormibacteraeota bacterium]
MPFAAADVPPCCAMGERRIASIGVIGGSGLYHFLEGAEPFEVDTPYGPPSDRLAVAEVEGRPVAFLARHGSRHTLPPHRINYRANLWALHHLGVERVLAPCAVGSLRAAHAPGEVVVCDQLVDRTSGRADTYFDGPEVAHLSAADPYCEELRPLAAAAARAAGLRVHEGGTVVVINGPRFSTRAESSHYAAAGWNVINMTQYPEVMLARELGMCYVNLSLVTDYDCGLEGAPEVRPVTQAEVFAVFSQNTERLRTALRGLVSSLPAERGCGCAAGQPQPLGHA